ncbi:K1210 protein, partial [Penelope pileata]|nr:K1210 protein [Penelope pileata]
KETPCVNCPTDAEPDSCNSTFVAECSCTLPQEDVCLPDIDHCCNAATSLLRPESSPVILEEHHSAAVSYCSDEAAGELKLHQQNTDIDVSILPKPQQIGAGAVVFPDVLAADLFSNGAETESISVLTDVAQRSSAKSWGQNAEDQEKEGNALSISQVAVADSGLSSDIKTGAVLKSENSSATRNDKETCENMENQSSKDNAEKKISTAASVVEAGYVLLPSKLEVCFKAEIPCPVSKGNQVSQQTSTSYASEKLSIECLASSSLAGLKGNTSSNDDSKEYRVSSTASHRKTEKDSQSSEENVQSPLKTAAAKPVRFTIAPAWQRSLSGGSNSKSDSDTRSFPATPVRPELFEGIMEEHTRFDAVIQDSVKNNHHRFDQDCKDGDFHLNSSTEWADHEAQNVENLFGVKLRRTSSLLKYQNESGESPKLIPSAAPTASASIKEDRKSVGTGKPLPDLPVSTIPFLKQTDLEDKDLPKTRSEDVTNKQNENVSSLHLETTFSEPSWISVAKLKQRGFQGRPLAREHKAEDKTSTKVDQEEVEYQVKLLG